MLDTELIKNIKQNIDTDSSIKRLLLLHGALINNISSKYAKPLMDSGSNVEDIMAERFYIVYKAALSFNDKRKVKFSSYLGSFTRWYCLNRINRKEKFAFIGDEYLENIPAENNDANIKEYIHYLIEKIKDKKIKKIFEMRYFSDKNKLTSWRIIGQYLGVSGQTANNWSKKGLKFLKKEIINTEHE